MKKKISVFHKPIQQILLGVAGLSLFLVSCTKDFKLLNTNPMNISGDLLKADFNYVGAFFPQIQSAIIFNFNNTTYDYQLQQNLIGDVYGGYLIPPSPFAGNINNMNYALVDEWNQTMFKLAYDNVMSPIREIKRLGAEKDLPDFWAIARILKVEAMHRVTDTYGPIPYSKFGTGSSSVEYDAQKDIYYSFFDDLDDAATQLKAYIAANPTSKPFAKFDMLYNGNYNNWIRFANSLRLRLAMRISKIDPARAHTEAEKAVNAANGGLIESNNDIAKVSGFGIKHPLNTISISWNDTRMSAMMDMFLNGYKDPRIAKYFSAAKDPAANGRYQGIRIGINIKAKSDYVDFSMINTEYINETTPIQLITAAEVDFLRAEGNLRGWNMGGTAKSFYESGISKSFNQLGAPIGNYLNDNTSTAIDYKDPKNANNNAKATTNITIKWDENDTNEKKLERIITQKWIAMFPDGAEAWSEFRRTGYPKLMPVVINNSGGKIDTKTQIRRINFPITERTNNAAAVQKAIDLLGGSDNGATRLWWDKAGSNL